MPNESPAPAVESVAVAEILRVYDVVPEMARLRRDVLMGDVWQQTELTPRERSMVTCAILAALGRNDELASHIKRGIGNGMSADTIRGMIVHTAFYAGWPTGLAIGRAALNFLEADAASPPSV
jgi:4-carboxymuconolactone decarboxylase